MQDFIPQFFYNPPPMPTPEDPDPFQTLMKTLLDIVGLPHHLAQGSGKDLVDYLFETPGLRTLMYKGLEDWGTPLELKGFGAFGVLSLLFWHQLFAHHGRGTHTLAHAMVMACVREGVEFHERGVVRQILVENGKAVGVQLSDGTEVKARKLVASNADLKQTLLGLVGEENASAHWAERTKAFKYGRSCVLGSVHMALNEAPDYKSAKHDPDINETFITVIGWTPRRRWPNTAGRPRRARSQRTPRSVQLMSFRVRSHLRPTGKHALSAWIFFPKASDLTREEWREVKRTYNDRVLERFEKWAPNMTRANVIADFFETPLDLEDDKGLPEGDFNLGGIYPDQMGGNRPFPEAALYRAEVQGLYLCSSGQHPAGGASAAAGYNAYKILAGDFDLSYKPWDTTGRGY